METIAQIDQALQTEEPKIFAEWAAASDEQRAAMTVGVFPLPLSHLLLTSCRGGRLNSG
jgi:hypothetical protein